MATPVCIKLHNFKKFKIEFEGQLYELAASSSENLLTEFQRYKPEVKQLLVARPIVADDFENLSEGSVVFASSQSYITDAQMQNCEVPQHGLPQLEYKTPLSIQNGQSMAVMNYSTSLNFSQPRTPEAVKLRTDLSMIDSYCSPPAAFIEAPYDSEPIDTMDVARRVRDVLERHKISQTLFSKYVSRRSQGTTSDLLRCPKPWDRMSEEGRIPYRRMKAWLEGDLQHNLQVLLRIKQGYDMSAAVPKCIRTKFTDEQKEALEAFLAQNPRLTHDTLEAFAIEQNLTISAVRNWVNNRKQRMKRVSTTSFEEGGAKYPRVDNSGDFDGGMGQSRSREFEASTFGELESEDDLPAAGVPTMVSPSTFKQSGMTHARSAGDFEESAFNGIVVNSPGSDVPTMANPTFKQERGIHETSECERSNINTTNNLTMDCLGVPSE